MHLFTKPSVSSDEEQKTPRYVESISEIPSRGESPPLTSSLHSRNSASSAQEESYLRKASAFKWCRLALAVVVTGIAVATVGVLSRVLHNYNGLHVQSDWHLTLWPIDIDVRPTMGTLIPAALSAVGTLAYIAFALIPSPHSRFLLQNIVFGGISIATAIASLTAIIFAYIANHRGQRDTIQSWTCFFSDSANEFAADTEALGIPQLAEPLVPSGFQTICTNSQVARYLMVTLFVLQLVGVAIAIVGIMLDRGIAKVRQSRYQGEEKGSFHGAS